MQVNRGLWNHSGESLRSVKKSLFPGQKVVGPGLVFTIPGLDHVKVVDLREAFSGWEGYGKEELKQKITSLVLDFPDGGERYGVKG